MTDHWITGLATERHPTPLSGWVVRQRGVDLLGPSATAWAVDAGQRMATYIIETLERWAGDGSEAELDSLMRATEASTIDTLCAIVANDLDALCRSREPRENVAYYVTLGFTLQNVLRNVQTGQNFILKELIEAIDDVVAPDERMDAIREANSMVASSWARFTVMMANEYAREVDRWNDTSDGARAQSIRRVLSNAVIDEAATSRDLDYDLSGRHVGVVLWLESEDIETSRLLGFERIADELARDSRAAVPPLVTRLGNSGVEAWIAATEPAVVEAFGSRQWPNRLRLAVGRDDVGREGFRTTIDEARVACALARSAPHLGSIVRFRDYEVEALLLERPERARRFVHRTLGPLAANDEWAAELRRTLATWIDHGASVSEAAKALFMHRNTVTNRLRVIDEQLGGTTDHVRLRCAIAVADLRPDEMLCAADAAPPS